MAAPVATVASAVQAVRGTAGCSRLSRGASRKRISDTAATATTSVAADQRKNRKGANRVALVRQRLAVPFVPLVTEPAIDVDVDQLRSGWIGHAGKIIVFAPMPSAPPLRGSFRTDAARARPTLRAPGSTGSFPPPSPFPPTLPTSWPSSAGRPPSARRWCFEVPEVRWAAATWATARWWTSPAP